MTIYFTQIDDYYKAEHPLFFLSAKYWRKVFGSSQQIQQGEGLEIEEVQSDTQQIGIKIENLSKTFTSGWLVCLSSYMTIL